MKFDKEYGRVGANRYGGSFFEEFLPELRGADGIKIYKEMADNDDMIGAVLFAIKMLIRQASWTVQPQGTTAADKKAAEFVESCLHDMSSTWTDTLSEILSFLTYGWSVVEIVYKRRMGRKRDPRLESKFDDGYIGWQKLPIRAQESLYEWEFDGDDNLTAFVQMPAPDFQIIRIPVEKILLFRTESRKENPEGRSILRNAYKSYYHNKRIQEIEGIGIERDLAGFPLLIAPEDMNIWEMPEKFAEAMAFVQNIRRDAMEGFVLPGGWELKLLSTGGARQFDTNAVIQRYDQAIARTVLADFILLGSQNVGSWALSSDKTRLFAMAIGAYLDIVTEVFNRQAIPALIDVNGKVFAGITDYPRLEHGDIETQDLNALGTFVKEMVGIGAITPDKNLENYLREQASLPQNLED
ncbi:MAG: hypothetical protein IJR52_09960 [Selenomonadaceae bacterium]|nr:hypothetical protein [Selenomonadaceae bacterium]